MYPTLVKFGSFEITTFGLMMFIAFVVGGWVLTKQFRRSGLSEELASTVVMAAALGGIVGAKIYYAILYHSWHELFTRAGLVWYGGLLGGAIVTETVFSLDGMGYYFVQKLQAVDLYAVMGWLVVTSLTIIGRSAISGA